jgi:hypothetical protein
VDVPALKDSIVYLRSGLGEFSERTTKSGCPSSILIGKVMSSGNDTLDGNVLWPMSNKELRVWFSRDNISIEELTEIWLHMDKNEATKNEILQLSKRKDGNNEVNTELEERLRKRIQFGTAGTSNEVCS